MSSRCEKPVRVTMNKIAIAQLESSTDKNKNLATARALIQEAKS